MRALPFVPEHRSRWNQVADQSPDAWFWHTTNWMDFVVEMGRGRQIRNVSFSLMEDTDIHAICPVFIEEVDGYRRFSYLGDFITAPAAAAHLSEPKRRDVRERWVEELHRLAAEHDVASVQVMTPALAPIRAAVSLPVIDPLLRLGFMDLPTATQLVDLTKSEKSLWQAVRKGHKADIRRGESTCKVHFWDAGTVTDTKFREYQDLHHKDAGRVTRSQRSFDIMHDWIRDGRAVLVESEHEGVPAAFALIMVYQAGAYYGSACKDPDLPDIPSSHVLQWKSMLWLKERGIRHYNLGGQPLGTQWHATESDKLAGLARFKSGFGSVPVRVCMVEHFFSHEARAVCLSQRFERLMTDVTSTGAASPQLQPAADAEAAPEARMGELKFRRATAEDRRLWNSLVDGSPTAWFWHSWEFKSFALSAFGDTPVEDLSFLVLRDGEPVGVAPLLVHGDPASGSTVASFYAGTPTPYPALLASVVDSDDAHRQILAEVDRLCSQHRAGWIRLFAHESTAGAQRLSAIRDRAGLLGYLDEGYDSHFVRVDAGTLSRVRKRFRQYVRNLRSGFECTIVDGDAVTSEFIDNYFRLHVADAGRQTRPRESFRAIGELAERGRGFFVACRHRESGRLVGILLIALSHGAAFDASVAVEPEFVEARVSHLLKWTAIERLLELGVTKFELGRRAGAPTFDFVPDPHFRGISHFKDGWSRGESTHVCALVRYYSPRALRVEAEVRLRALSAAVFRSAGAPG